VGVPPLAVMGLGALPADHPAELEGPPRFGTPAAETPTDQSPPPAGAGVSWGARLSASSSTVA